jgi:CheY-like chemotaxis protein
VDPGESRPPTEAAEPGSNSEAASLPRRVLVADDDPLTLRMVSAIVETEGYQVVSVGDGRQALSILQQDATFGAAIFLCRQNP